MYRVLNILRYLTFCPVLDKVCQMGDETRGFLSTVKREILVVEINLPIRTGQSTQYREDGMDSVRQENPTIR